MINKINDGVNVDTSINNVLDKIDWRHVLALDCSYSVDSIGNSGRFSETMAIAIAKEDKSIVRDNKGVVVADFRGGQL